MKLTRQVFFIIAIFFVIIVIFYFLNYTNRDTNIILITIDALRPDHLGCYGYKRNTSPNIDKLAREGVVFKEVISQAPWTPPSISSIITSTYPSTHGVVDFGQNLNPGLKVLPSILKENFYCLALISGRGRLAEFHFPELERDFDFFYPFNQNYIQAEEVTENAVEWLRVNKKKRFFLWLYYLDPHTPYSPPFPYNELFINDEFISSNNKKVPIADESNDLYDGYGVIPRITLQQDITDIGYYISQYDGEIRYVDDQIGRLLKELKELNLYDNTLIVIISDHGESLGEHNYYFVHGESLYDELLKVPLIFKPKDITQKAYIDNQVQSIDVAPTILDFIEVRIPETFEGKSLLSLIQKGEHDCQYAFSELEGQVSVRTKGWKLIYDYIDDRYELYNLKEDPNEFKNLIDTEEIQEISFLKKRLNDFIAERQFSNNLDTDIFSLSEETKIKLKSLGYLQ